MDSFQTGEIFPTLCKALIILLLNHGNSPTYRDSSQPVSLINYDAMIIVKMWD